MGLGLPWVIATHYSAAQSGEKDGFIGYFVPSASVGFSVVVFATLATIGLIFLCLRRKIVGGELGGSPTGRLGGAIFMISLWVIYLLFSILQTVGALGKPEDLAMGIDLNAKNIISRCNK